MSSATRGRAISAGHLTAMCMSPSFAGEFGFPLLLSTVYSASMVARFLYLSMNLFLRVRLTSADASAGARQSTTMASRRRVAWPQVLLNMVLTDQARLLGHVRLHEAFDEVGAGVPGASDGQHCLPIDPCV